MKYILLSIIGMFVVPICVVAQEVPTLPLPTQFNAEIGQRTIDGQDSQLQTQLLPVPTQIPPPVPLGAEGENIDFAYGAYQRGFYLTALQLATQEALNGDHAAQALLGILYQNGAAVPRDLQKAREWYEIASNNGNPQATYQLGLFYSEGIGGLDKDPDQAYKYFTVASDAGNLSARLNLALLYLVGDAVPRDLDKAVELLESVAEMGLPDAQYILGVALFDGELGIPNKELGMFWLKKAAENHHVSAQVRYGINRYQGVGVEADQNDGAQWLLKAANAGNPVAMNRVAKIYRIGAGLNIDAIEAAKWHIISQHWEGIPDLDLEQFVISLTEEEREEANKRVEDWIF